MAFGIGDTVRWSSQAGGVRKEKVGEVVAVVAAKLLPNREQFLSLYKGAGIGISRDHESYVVRVRTGKTATKDYWPRANSLSAVYPPSPVAEPLTVSQLLEKLAIVAERPGQAEAHVALAYHIGRTTLGPTPQVGVVGVHGLAPGGYTNKAKSGTCKGINTNSHTLKQPRRDFRLFRPGAFGFIECARPARERGSYGATAVTQPGQVDVFAHRWRPRILCKTA